MKRKCKICGEVGHILRSCNNEVHPSFRGEEQWGAENSEENGEGSEAELQDDDSNLTMSVWYVCLCFFLLH